MRDAIIPYRINHLSLSSYTIRWVVSLLKGYEKNIGRLSEFYGEITKLGV
jgi:hypothetical protein